MTPTPASFAFKLTLWILALLPAAPAFAQNYVPFPTDSARWRVMYGMSIFGCTGFAGEAQYEITGDTVIASQTYHKIYRISYSAGPGCYATGGNGFVCGIREDSAKHVFMRADTAAETLLYDFNLNVGDTVLTWQDCCHDAIVTSIDSVLIGSSYRKRFNITTGFMCGITNQSIIEGIGSTSGLFECFGLPEETSDLICFWQNGNAVYPSQSVNCSPLVEGIRETYDTPVLTAYPNPATEEAVVSWSSPGGATFDHFFIYDITGQKLRSENINPGADKITIARDRLPAGIYFVELVTATGATDRTMLMFQ